MRNIIRQSVILPASAETLFEMYLDPVAHSAFTGNPVEIASESGSRFQSFDGVLTGEILEVVKPELIVQSWRSKLFNAENPDSTLILHFSQEGNQGKIDLIHLDVPDHDFQDVIEGWGKYYWTPWRAYLENL